MFCSRCGKENVNDAKFCSSCGANIGTVAEIKSIENVSNENINKKVWLSIIGLVIGVLVIAIALKVFNNNYTALMWQDDAEVKTVQKDWQGAIDYCSDLSLDGFDDWRLPKIEELESISDDPQSDTAIKLGFENGLGDYYWSSSSSVKVYSYAWNVYFDCFSVSRNLEDSSPYVRCVRDSK